MPLSYTVPAYLYSFHTQSLTAAMEPEPMDVETQLKTQELTQDALFQALKGCTTEFTGNFYYCSTDPTAPIPGLTIEGLGLIGLPLTDEIAKSIISRAAQAPFGKGTKTIIDTDVRDTWEIEPSSISFANPKWDEYVEHLASQTVWTALGIAPFTTKPRCELHKLLLYQTGSHFLPHQDTLKSDGMFATIIIVLPSAFQGGEVHVSHAGETKILDVSRNSAFNTTVLAWYTDVMHEVKPVTSGFRLALSYNLIHTSPNAPQPCLPSADSARRVLRQCLQKWKDGGFTDLPEDNPLTVSLLDHQYSTSDLDRGLEALKGKDAHTLSQVLPIANDLGFAVCLGNLTKTEKGYPEDDFGYSTKMADVEDEFYDVSHLVRINGESTLDIRFKDFSLYRECLVPEDIFADIEPDDQDYEGYQGNEAGTLEQWYRRSVLILFRIEDEIDIAISVNGSKWAHEQLKANQPREKTEKLVAAALRSLGSSNSQSEIAEILMDKGIEWKRVEWWNEAVPRCDSVLHKADAHLTAALAVFGLEAIKPGLAELIKRKEALQARFAVITEVASRVDDEGKAWLEDLEKLAVSTYDAANTSDIPLVIQFVQNRGVEAFAGSLTRSTQKTRSYEFLVALTHALHDCEASVEAGKEKPAIVDLVHRCVVLAISEWHVVAQPRTSYGYNYQNATVKTERLPELVNLCFKIGQPDLCIKLYESLPQNASFLVHFELAKALHGRLAKDTLAESTRATLANVVRSSLEAAIPKWEEGLSVPSSRDWQSGRTQVSTNNITPNFKTNRICDILDVCFNIGDKELCVVLLDRLLQPLANNSRVQERFEEIFIPLVPQLKPVLAKHGMSITSEPFRSFFKAIVSSYLSSILTPHIPKKLTSALPTRNAGCGRCSECGQLKAFINNSAPNICFQLHMNIRKHIEAEITKARISDIVTTETVKYSSPHTLVVTKRPELVAQLAWKEAQANASQFLKNVGNEDELKRIMGERYNDVGMALRGTKAFTTTAGDLAINQNPSSAGGSLGSTGGSQTGAASSTSTSVLEAISASGEAVAGRKRKRGELPANTIAVIDLT
ncbi:hypothetical protein NMY22_g7900 [Coprinellus aureogranulatus]|nr:hypothetical protein NMY22_g7900 [Coprinellus aureogranulatus]